MIGETTFNGDPMAEPPPPASAPSPTPQAGDGNAYGYDEEAGGGMTRGAMDAMQKRVQVTSSNIVMQHGAGAPARSRTESKPKQEIDYESLRRSTLAEAKSATMSGLTRFDLDSRVTVPQGTSTMVAVINADVDGEETFLFRPGGAGSGFETNPYRVVRFKNTTPFVLEPGPISIYSGGSFVGEGLSEAVGTTTSATIPFAVETGMMVTSTVKSDADEMRLLKISRGVLEIESFGRRQTTWTVKSQTRNDGFNVLIRHPKAGWNFELAERPEGTEDLPDAYLLKLPVPKGSREASMSVTEQTPSKRSISIWENPALPVMEKLMLATDLPGDLRGKLQPIIDKRRAIGKIDEQIDGLERQRQANDQRANETRENLKSIEKNTLANDLRAKLTKKLDDFSSEGNKLGKELADLQRQRMEKRIDLEDALQGLEIVAPAYTTRPGAAGITH